MPSGFARRDASLASWVVAAMPTEQVMRCSSVMRARMCSPTAVGDANVRNDPDTSRNASSSETGWTSEVTERNTSTTADDTALNSVKPGATTTRCGHMRRACAIDMPEETPYARAG